MFESVERLVRLYGIPLMWAEMAGWSAVAMAALVLAQRGRDRGAWFASGATAAMLAVEMVGSYRYVVSAWFRAALKTIGEGEAYAGRRPVQGVLIGLLVGLAVLALAVFVTRARRPSWSCKLTLVGLAVGALGFLVETVSLHQIDQNYAIYWVFWWSGLAVAGSAALWALIVPAGGVARVSPGASRPVDASRGGPEGHVRYRVGGTVSEAMQPRVGSVDARGRHRPSYPVVDTPLRMAGRLAVVAALLALPEVVAWMTPAAPSHPVPPAPAGAGADRIPPAGVRPLSPPR